MADAAEVDPPVCKPPLHWCLLTTHAGDSLDQAHAVLGWYRARWSLEPVFRTLTSAGKAVEASQVPEARRFVKLATTAPIAAVRTMQLAMARVASTGQPLGNAAADGDKPMLHASCAMVEGRTAAQPSCPAQPGLARLDRRPPGRLVRECLRGIQAAGTAHLHPRPRQARRHRTRMDPSSFQTSMTA